MAEYTVEAHADLQELVPPQADFYRNQLRSITDLTMRGAGFDVGVGSSASQYYLRIGGGVTQNVPSLVWQSPSEPEVVNFAVLPPREGMRNYFGTVNPGDHDEDRLWVEGVDLQPAGGRYSRLLMGYEPLIEPARRIPMAIGAFIDTMRENVTPPTETDSTLVVGLDHDTHQKLGGAILSFWQTLSAPPGLAAEHAGSKSAFDLANLILVREVERYTHGGTDSRFETVRLHRDARGNVAGFVGKDIRSNSVLALVRNNTVYPERIDYIQIPLSSEGDESVVSHYAISGRSIATRVCVLSSSLTNNENIGDLIRTIQRKKQPLEVIDDDSIGYVVRELHAELGRLVQIDE